ncbi:MAG: hypothetical protein AMXMBFR60_13180 [Chloroflexota bacterium]|nr:DUF2029 domain-containing protein [Anaerolineales bacterium]
MKRNLLFPLALLLLLAILLALAVYLPIPVTPYMDFQVIYIADKGILNGIPLYDRAGQLAWVARESGRSAESLFILPFPYPPWYAVATLPIAFLPIDAAARMWFLLNIVMLLASAWLFTDGWESRRRLLSFIAVFAVLPVLGALIVGQYVFPALLGMALIVHGLRRERTDFLAIGMGLVTFKPHIGIFALAATLLGLLARRDAFGRKSFAWTAVAGVILFLTGFFADQAWPIAYLRSLFDFRNVSECEICVSLPLTIGKIFGLGFDQSAPTAAILLGLAIALFAAARSRLGGEASLAFFACVPLLVNPYLLNYDFSFMLVPLFFLAGNATSKMDWLWIAALIILPWAGLLTFQRAGNPVLIFCALAAACIVLTRIYKGNTIAS